MYEVVHDEREGTCARWCLRLPTSECPASLLPPPCTPATPRKLRGSEERGRLDYFRRHRSGAWSSEVLLWSDLLDVQWATTTWHHALQHTAIYHHCSVPLSTHFERRARSSVSCVQYVRAILIRHKNRKASQIMPRHGQSSSWTRPSTHHRLLTEHWSCRLCTKIPQTGIRNPTGCYYSLQP